MQPDIPTALIIIKERLAETDSMRNRRSSLAFVLFEF